MQIGIRKKLVFAISLFLVILFSLVAYLFITEKQTELANDTYRNALAFTKLTAPSVVQNYDLYLSQGGFVYFNREIENLFEQNDDIMAIKVITFEGDILYDSNLDTEKAYTAGGRMVEDSELIQQLQSEHISIKTLPSADRGKAAFDESTRILYLKDSDIDCELEPAICESLGVTDFGISYVDMNEKSISQLESGSLIDYLVVPASEKYSVVYVLDYENLRNRVNTMMRRIILLAIFGIMLGMLMSFYMSGTVTKPVRKLVKGAKEIAKGDFKTRVKITSRDELEYLGDTFNRMAKDLEASVDARLYKERVTRELELATEIQNNLVPKKIPVVKGLDITAGLIPAEEIGGDMYDFLPISEDRLIFYLGDVTGHGVPAGIVSSIASALFYGYANEKGIGDMMVNVNRVLCAKTVTTMFMTLTLMEWIASTGSFSYVSAGHEKLVHYQAQTGKADFTPAGGIALGMMGNFTPHVKVQNVNLQVGDFIIIYSDGIPEAWNDQNEQYGFDRFLAVVQRAAQASDAKLMKEAILKDLTAFVGQQKQMDDITLIVIKRIP